MWTSSPVLANMSTKAVGGPSSQLAEPCWSWGPRCGLFGPPKLTMPGVQTELKQMTKLAAVAKQASRPTSSIGQLLRRSFGHMRGWSIGPESAWSTCRTSRRVARATGNEHDSLDILGEQSAAATPARDSQGDMPFVDAHGAGAGCRGAPHDHTWSVHTLGDEFASEPWCNLPSPG